LQLLQKVLLAAAPVIAGEQLSPDTRLTSSQLSATVTTVQAARVPPDERVPAPAAAPATGQCVIDLTDEDDLQCADRPTTHGGPQGGMSRNIDDHRVENIGALQSNTTSSMTAPRLPSTSVGANFSSLNSGNSLHRATLCAVSGLTGVRAQLHTLPVSEQLLVFYFITTSMSTMIHGVLDACRILSHVCSNVSWFQMDLNYHSFGLLADVIPLVLVAEVI